MPVPNPVRTRKTRRGPLHLPLPGLYMGALIASTALIVASPAAASAAASLTFGPPVLAGGAASLHGVSCTVVGDCTAVGGEGGGPQYLTETNGTWGPLNQLSSPSGRGSFFAVSCTDATDCTAVGFDNGALPSGAALYATETHGLWGPVTDLPGPLDSTLWGVSCTDATDCTAVGNTW